MIGGRDIHSAAAPAFDQRPGALEATRGMDPVPLVCGRHDPDGWKVTLLLGGGAQLALTPDQARELALELGAMADVCEGKWGL